MRLRDGFLIALLAMGAPVDGAEARLEPGTPRLQASFGGEVQQTVAGGGALDLEEVLESVKRSYPLLLRALQEQEIAEAELLSAQGSFDLKLKSKSGTEQFGYYKNRILDGSVEQPLQMWGMDLYSGYKRGGGNFGPWREDRLTLSDGEWRAGLSIPLWRDRAIDDRRADLRIAEAGLDVAANSVAKQRIKIYQEATKRYWEWLATGLQVQVTRDLLRLATERNENLAESVRLGDVAAIELTDNERAILQRRSQVLVAERFLQGAAIELGLFYRAGDGSPRRPPDARLPGGFPGAENLSDEQFGRDLSHALANRPEIQGLLAKRRQLDVEVRLARNQLGPDVELSTEYSRDFGGGSITKVGSEVKASLTFELPAQRRKARGKIAAQQAKLTQLQADLQFARDRITADVQDAAIAVRTAYEAAALVAREVDVAVELERAERERFDLGDSTLFLVNLRELATADARMRLIKALAEYQKAFADYRAASGRILEDLTASPSTGTAVRAPG